MFSNKPRNPAGARPKAVIVGAGFGGLAAAKRLANQPIDVTLIDQRNYHLFQLLLYGPYLLSDRRARPLHCRRPNGSGPTSLLEGARVLSQA
jgi:cation diffusion facilitator CzcD-associated flavoprotein CzcO